MTACIPGAASPHKHATGSQQSRGKFGLQSCLNEAWNRIQKYSHRQEERFDIDDKRERRECYTVLINSHTLWEWVSELVCVCVWLSVVKETGQIKKKQEKTQGVKGGQRRGCSVIPNARIRVRVHLTQVMVWRRRPWAASLHAVGLEHTLPQEHPDVFGWGEAGHRLWA